MTLSGIRRVRYGLGDVDVLTALDWSSKVFQGKGQSYPREVIQVVRNTKSAQEDPYRLENGIVVVEVEDIADFFDEFVEAIPRWKKQRSRRKAKIKEVLNIFREAAPDDVTDFLEDGEWRRNILAALPKYEIEFVREFEVFLNKVVDQNRKLSSRNDAFRECARLPCTRQRFTARKYRHVARNHTPHRYPTRLHPRYASCG